MTRVKVWDVAVRGFHWALALLVALAFLTGDEDETVGLHARLGLAVVGLLVFRGAWGLWGPPHARFRSFVRPLGEVLAYARACLRGRPPHHLGHNPLGGLMVVALLATLTGLTVTGTLVFLGPEWDGPLSPWLGRGAARGLKSAHEALTAGLGVLVGLHVAGVLGSSLLERQNLVAGMLTGFKRASGPVPAAPPPRRGAMLAALLLGAAVVLALAVLLPAGAAHAAGPQRALLEDYAAQARREQAGFGGFDAARGRALYFEEHVRDGRPTSCATCHTDEPRRGGRSPAGKVIEPLAPSAAPERFSDAGKADKWFGRNCKQVLGRPCSAAEKGHLLTWLLTQ